MLMSIVPLDAVAETQQDRIEVCRKSGDEEVAGIRCNANRVMRS